MEKNYASTLPDSVLGRAKAAGQKGLEWLASLDRLLSDLESLWNIQIGKTLSGGSHACVAEATGANGQPYIVKLEIPDISEEEYMRGIHALKIADGQGYCRLYAFDSTRRACLLERLGSPLRLLNYPPQKQMAYLCDALRKTWTMDPGNVSLPDAQISIDWFRSFLPKAWEELGRPCHKEIITRGLSFLDLCQARVGQDSHYLLHGDAHNNNLLQSLVNSEDFSFIDPEGLIGEKAYDLGVIMREWPDELDTSPATAAVQRAEYLSRLTGVPQDAIWQWGYLQTVSTSLILLQIGQEELAHQMLRIALLWVDSPGTDD